MRVSRFFVDPKTIDAAAGTAVIEDANQVKQIFSVLRLREGDAVDLLDGGGLLYHCVVSEKTFKGRMPKALRLTISQIERAPGEPKVNLVVALPVLRHARFEWALEKLTEIGIKTVVPLLVERSVIDYGLDELRSVKREERWRSIVKEAAEQCERPLIPNVVKPTSLKEFIGRSPFASAGLRLIACERSQSPALKEALCNLGDQRHICILIGAEGGFTEQEISLSFAHGFQPVSLGKRILRAETAALYAASIVMALLDE